MDTFELLAAQILKDQGEYKTEDPFYQGGLGMDAILATMPKYNLKPWEAILAGALGGFGSGVLKGIGTASADQKSSAITTKLAKALELTGDAQTEAFNADPALSKYGVIAEIADIQEKREREEAARELKAKAIADITMGDGVKRDVMDKEGRTTQMERAYDPLTGTFTWQEYGRGQSTTEKKLAEALAEKTAGNTLYGGGFDPIKQAELEDKQRNEIKGGIPVEQFQKGETAFQNMLQAYSDDSGASDLDFLYGSIQTREPGMAVRKDDQDLVRAGNGLGGVFADAAGYLQSKRKFTAEMRKAMLDSAARSRNARIDAMGADFENARGIAERRKVNPDNVIPFALPEKSDPLIAKALAGGAPPPNMTFEQFQEWKRARGK